MSQQQQRFSGPPQPFWCAPQQPPGQGPSAQSGQGPADQPSLLQLVNQLQQSGFFSANATPPPPTPPVCDHGVPDQSRVQEEEEYDPESASLVPIKTLTSTPSPALNPNVRDAYNHSASKFRTHPDRQDRFQTRHETRHKNRSRSPEYRPRHHRSRSRSRSPSRSFGRHRSESRGAHETNHNHRQESGYPRAHHHQQNEFVLQRHAQAKPRRPSGQSSHPRRPTSKPYRPPPRTTATSYVQRRHKAMVDEPSRGETNPSRRLVNLLKRLLFQKHIAQGAEVLDLCSGRGQDMRKFFHCRAKSVVLIDQSDEQIRLAEERYRQIREDTNMAYRGTACSFLSFALGMTNPVIYAPLDIVSCQLGMHYLWEREESTQSFLETVTKSLKPNGKFLITIVDSEQIPLMGVRDHPFIHLSSCYRLKDAQMTDYHRWAYRFTFPGLVTNLQEAVISLCELRTRLLERDTILIERFAFSDVADTIATMDRHLRATESDVRVANLYQCCAFQKIDGRAETRLGFLMARQKRVIAELGAVFRSCNMVVHERSHTFHQTSGRPDLELSWIVADFF